MSSQDKDKSNSQETTPPPPPPNNFHWPPHHPLNAFSSIPTPASRIHNTLSRAAVAQYYPHGFPPDWEDSPEELAAAAAERVAQTRAAAKMVDDLTRERRATLCPAKADRTRIEPYLDAVLEEGEGERAPATPRVRMAGLARGNAAASSSSSSPSPPRPRSPTPSPRSYSPPTTPPSKEKKKKPGSPLRQSWTLPESDDL